jgi:hypothetical protein
MTDIKKELKFVAASVVFARMNPQRSMARHLQSAARNPKWSYFALSGLPDHLPIFLGALPQAILLRACGA